MEQRGSAAFRTVLVQGWSWQVQEKLKLLIGRNPLLLRLQKEIQIDFPFFFSLFSLFVSWHGCCLPLTSSLLRCKADQHRDCVFLEGHSVLGLAKITLLQKTPDSVSSSYDEHFKYCVGYLLSVLVNNSSCDILGPIKKKKKKGSL